MIISKVFPRPSIDRRSLLAAGAASGVMLAAGVRPAMSASAERRLRIGFISPRTGALAEFGHTDGYVLSLARKRLARGIVIDGKTWEVTLLDRDTQSDPSRSSQLAKALINEDKIDMMLLTSTPETINPAADACEAAGVPCLSTVMPWEAWYFGRGAKPGQPSPFKWTYHFSFGVGEFNTCYVSQWGLLKTNRKVGALYSNDADGNAIRAHLAPLLAHEGFTIVDPGPYEDGTTDFTAQIGVFKREHCEIFNSFPIPRDFAAFWRQATQQGFSRKVAICQVAKTGLFPDGIEALGGLGYNIASAAYWHRLFPYTSPLTGVTGPELADGYEQASGQQWTQQLGATMSLLDAGMAALQNSGDPTAKSAVAQALGRLVTKTMVGTVDFTHGPVSNVATAPIIGTQWVKSAPGSRFPLDYLITEHATDPNVPIQAKLRPYHA